MCGRFVQIVDIELFLKRFGVKKPVDISVQSNFNVAPGDLAYVITNDKPDELQALQFGLTPKWAKKQMYLINARSEGDFNKEDDILYSGKMGIVDKPAFRDSIQSRRCIVIANGYIEGPQKEKLNKPYLIAKEEYELFAFAGIWDKWTDRNTGKIVNSFSIITTVSNKATTEIGHNRSPVILNRRDERKWLDTNLPLEAVLHLLHPYPGDDFNIKPISIQIKDPKRKVSDLFLPIDSYLTSTYESIEKKKKQPNLNSPDKQVKKPSDQQGTLF